MKQKYWISIIAALLVIYPSAFYFYTNGIQSVFSFFAADSFYYLTIAKNHFSNKIFSYDTIYPTNGFHPFWEIYLTTAFTNITKLYNNQVNQILFTYLSSLTLVAAAAFIITSSMMKLTHNNILVLICIVPGLIYYLIQPDVNYGSLWSFINGMESGFSLLLFSMLFSFSINSGIYRRNDAKTYVIAAIIISIAILSRLDDIFLIPAFVLPLFLKKGYLRLKVLRAFILTAIPAFVILIYMLFNFMYAGTPLPVSGQMKTGFSPINFLYIIDLFIPLVKYVFYSHGVHWAYNWQCLAWRTLYNVLPLIISLIFIANFFVKQKISPSKNKNGNASSVLLAFSIYVFLKGLYDFLFISMPNQGHWYYPISIVYSNIIVSLYFISKFKINDSWKSKLILISIILLALVGGSIFIVNKEITKYNQLYYAFWNNRFEINSNINKLYKGKGILEFDDGIIAYSLAKPVMSGTGFSLDMLGMSKMKNGELLDIAYNRGFRLITSLVYMPSMPDVIGSDVTQYLKNAYIFKGQNIDPWRFKLIYVEPITGCKFIEFMPRQELM